MQTIGDLIQAHERLGWTKLDQARRRTLARRIREAVLESGPVLYDRHIYRKARPGETGGGTTDFVIEMAPIARKQAIWYRTGADGFLHATFDWDRCGSDAEIAAAEGVRLAADVPVPEGI